MFRFFFFWKLDGEGAIRELCAAIVSSGLLLEELILRNCGLTSKGAATLAYTLEDGDTGRCSKCLRVLDLADNNIGAVGSHALAAFLQLQAHADNVNTMDTTHAKSNPASPRAAGGGSAHRYLLDENKEKPTKTPSNSNEKSDHRSMDEKATSASRHYPPRLQILRLARTQVDVRQLSRAILKSVYLTASLEEIDFSYNKVRCGV